VSWGEACSSNTGDERNVYKLLVRKPEGNSTGNLGEDTRILLKWILNKYDVNMCVEVTWLRKLLLWI
jgi:hypothetical protein